MILCSTCLQEKERYKIDRKQCKDCYNLQRRNYYVNNKEKIQTQNKKWTLCNPEKVKEIKLRHYIKSPTSYSKWAKENPEKRRIVSKNYASRNLEYYAKEAAKRRASKLKAIPIWLGKEEEFLIQEAYDLAKQRTILLGFNWEVDHIVPLQNKFVCGLHTIDNLRVIPRKMNRSKSNKHDLDVVAQVDDMEEWK